MSVKIGADGKYYYTTSRSDFYYKDRYTGTSTSSNDISWTVLPIKPVADLDADWGASELKWYNASRKKQKKEEHLLEDDLFEI